MPKKRKLLLARVEKIEAAIAYLGIEGGGLITIPIKQIPFKVKHGLWINIELEPNPKEGARRRREIRELQKNLLERTRKRKKRP